MENTFEISGKAESRDYCHDFVRRLKEAKKKGFKFSGQITENELRNFENGKPVKTELRSKPLEYTSEDRARSLKRNLQIIADEKEKRERDERLNKLRAELRAEDKQRSIEKSLGAPVKSNTETKTTLFL